MCVRTTSGAEFADPVGDGHERCTVDLERIVAEVEALERGAERGGTSFSLAEVAELRLSAIHEAVDLKAAA